MNKYKYHNKRIKGTDTTERTISFLREEYPYIIYVLINPDNINTVNGEHFKYKEKDIDKNISKGYWKLL